MIASLSPRDRAAQLVWPQLLADYAPDGSDSWERVATLVSREHVGGFVMSIGSPIETAAKINELQRLSPVPLLFGSDYEAGAGFRTRGGYFLPNGIYLGGATLFPPQMALGATGDSTLAYEQGRVTAIEGRAVGVHFAFAPVLDVNNNPNNPVIGPRSFGEDPLLVANLGSAIIRGLQEHGLAATGKHFPGHGDTDQNSHLGITTVSASRPRLDSLELVPFRRAVSAGVAAIMTFHGVVPALDTTPVPATLSPIVMRGLLRREMGFGGLLITDALDMNGVLARVRPSGQGATLSGIYGAIDSPGLAEVVKLAVDAGNDVLLMPLDVPTAIDAVVSGVNEGRFTQARVDSSVRRVLLFKHSLGLHRRRFVAIDSVRHVVGSASHLAVADRIAERSITLAKDSLGVVPFVVSSPTRPRVMSITLAPRADLGAGVAFDAELRSAADVRSEWVDAADPSAALARVSALADSAELVVVGSYLGAGTRVANLGAPNAIVDLVRAVSSRNPRTIVVAFGNPYFYQQVSFTPAYLIAWGGFPASQRAAARALLGTNEISGRLPIAIPPALRLGDGIHRSARAPR
ncbi:MAG TPA: glycoside hydrolase family 3 N-terminal domain-containing protein [Gemmatimonadaceae bacterium]|nr:glycoside hydrolase family 3 N-terminal domain-containing protein [Gemmatimonadaceae bacterium]